MSHCRVDARRTTHCRGGVVVKNGCWLFGFPGNGKGTGTGNLHWKKTCLAEDNRKGSDCILNFHSGTVGFEGNTGFR
jgi:hypothetical protein